jgi:FMN-dependent NADH-azoreductase
MSHLKALGHTVSLINMRSLKPRPWIERAGGLDRDVPVAMSMYGQSEEYLEQAIRALGWVPDEVVLLANHALALYTFDEDLVRMLVSVWRKVFPKVPIRITGEFVEIFPQFAHSLGLELCYVNLPLEEFAPDLSRAKEMGYGVFQLMKGCPNRCSFCIASKQKFKLIPIDIVIGHMKEWVREHRPDTFWNWDPNVSVVPGHLEKFLDAYAASGIGVPLSFAMGIQPNRLTPSLIKKLSRVRLNRVTVPFESGGVVAHDNINKPYTIISAVKGLHAITFKKLASAIQCSFIIGYPHDDHRSIFRVYLSVLKFKASPLVFPLYVFPFTVEYARSRALLEGRGFCELHGDLWPIFKRKDVTKYQNLFEFLRIDTLSKALQNLHLLTPELRRIFLEEKRCNDIFVGACLKEEKDSLEALKAIEAKMERSRSRPQTVLYITANPRSLRRSSSKQLGEYWLEKYLQKRPDAKVIRIDLYKELDAFINDEYIDVIYRERPDSEVSAKTRALLALADKFIEQLRQADRVLIATPMWTLSIPAILKAFFEMVASRLFYYYGDSISIKPVYCILTRDGVYSSAKGEIFSVQETMLKAVITFIGLGKDIVFLKAEGFYIKNNFPKIMLEAKRKIAEYHRSLPVRIK